MKTCFISGAITGVENYKENFIAAEDQVKELGYIPVNPARMTESLVANNVEFTNDQWLEITSAVLKQCDAIYMLSDWHDSKGAKQEYFFAKLLFNKKILYQNPEDETRMKVDSE